MIKPAGEAQTADDGLLILSYNRAVAVTVTECVTVEFA